MSPFITPIDLRLTPCIDASRCAFVTNLKEAKMESVWIAGKVFEVFYDGDCPLCMREINMIRRKDKESKILFSDIAAQGFNPSKFGLAQGELMDRIHGRMPDGKIVSGVEVFRQLYTAIGFRKTVKLTRLPLISHLLDLAYIVFAKNRLRFTGRCKDDVCAVKES